jgi:phosphoesterase RecJ-like protein
MRIDHRRAAALLAAADDILLLCHRDPDGDTYGSAMALFDALSRMGRRVRVECVSPFPRNLDYLDREMPQFAPRFVAAIDTASPGMLGEPGDRPAVIDLCIDHHPTNPLYAKETFLVDYAATGEAVFEVIRELGVPITPYCATALYTALCSDTGGFRYSNTTAQTLRTAADLMEAGADFNLIRIRLFESKSRGHIRVESQALSGIRYYAGGRIAVISVSLAMMEQSRISEAELEGMAAKPLQIEGVDIGITLKERDDGSIRVSMRSSDAADSAAICQQFEGGGHLRAAGCRVFGPLDAAERALVLAAHKGLS